mmetsp:Transcript_27604/g.60480  ORF Transcript_27604/g.60480 Transcript_27604/m.60480 type:complete len:232 (-) Transcript_27604:184-879(-)
MSARDYSQSNTPTPLRMITSESLSMRPSSIPERPKRMHSTRLPPMSSRLLSSNGSRSTSLIFSAARSRWPLRRLVARCFGRRPIAQMFNRLNCTGRLAKATCPAITITDGKSRPQLKTSGMVGTATSTRTRTVLGIFGRRRMRIQTWSRRSNQPTAVPSSATPSSAPTTGLRRYPASLEQSTANFSSILSIAALKWRQRTSPLTLWSIPPLPLRTSMTRMVTATAVTMSPI